MTFKNYQKTNKAVHDHTDCYKHKESVVIFYHKFYLFHSNLSLMS